MKKLIKQAPELRQPILQLIQLFHLSHRQRTLAQLSSFLEQSGEQQPIFERDGHVPDTTRHLVLQFLATLPQAQSPMAEILAYYNARAIPGQQFALPSGQEQADNSCTQPQRTGRADLLNLFMHICPLNTLL